MSVWGAEPYAECVRVCCSDTLPRVSHVWRKKKKKHTWGHIGCGSGGEESAGISQGPCINNGIRLHETSLCYELIHYRTQNRPGERRSAETQIKQPVRRGALGKSRLIWFQMKRWICREGRNSVCVCECVFVFFFFFFVPVLILTRSHTGTKEGGKKRAKRISPVSSGSSLNMFSKLSCTRRRLMWGRSHAARFHTFCLWWALLDFGCK